MKMQESGENYLETILILKQEKETVNQELYSYMHDIFGADVINLFDTKYKIENPDGGRK